MPCVCVCAHARAICFQRRVLMSLSMFQFRTQSSLFGNRKQNLKRNQDSNVAMLFDMMDADAGGTVSKFEFIEFLREHKPKAGRWGNVAKLQEGFGLMNKSEIDMDAFQAGFKKCVGLKITDFEIFDSMA